MSGLKSTLSRQARWQHRKIAEGKCPLCGNDKGYNLPKCCEVCLAKHRIYARKVKGLKPWIPGGRGRPPLDSKGLKYSKIRSLLHFELKRLRNQYITGKKRVEDEFIENLKFLWGPKFSP